MSIKEKSIVNAISLDELSEARTLIHNNLLDRIGTRIQELKGTIKILEDKKNEEDTEVEEEDTEYQKFFRKALEKFDVSSPAEFESEEKKKEFFDYVDKEYKGKKEQD